MSSDDLVAALVADHLLRAGWMRSRDYALAEAEQLVLTVRTGLRWDLDYDQLTPQHHAARAALAAKPEPGLDAAWAAAEAALPDGWTFHGVGLDDNSMEGGGWGPGWHAAMSNPRHCERDDCDHDEANVVGTGPTPAAALLALAGRPLVHEPGEPHRYGPLVCDVCGARGQINLSIEPQRAP